ncbi:MAG TPA: hypothetical protein VFF65_08915 [Phycisphaerales bacterium]|nr:hypothetical protein [Phycisphaerales bacterium]
MKLRNLRVWLGPLRRPYYVVTDRRLVMVEPDAYFGIEPGVTSFRAENLPPGGTLKQHRLKDDLCLRYAEEGAGIWLRSVPDADRMEERLAALKGGD